MLTCMFKSAILSQSHAFVCGPSAVTGNPQFGGFGSTSGHVSHLQRHNLNNNSYNYTGGQYAKYGKVHCTVI